MRTIENAKQRKANKGFFLDQTTSPRQKGKAKQTIQGGKGTSNQSNLQNAIFFNKKMKRKGQKYSFKGTVTL